MNAPSEDYETDRKVYRIDDGELHWFVATSMSHAVKLYESTYDVDECEGLCVRCELSHLRISIVEDGTNDKQEKTAAQWANDADGCDILCSTLY
jgi:hypothetical protein